MPPTVTKKQAPTPESLQAQLGVAQAELNKKKGIQPTVSASELASPPAKLNLTVPQAPIIPPRVDTMVNNTLGSIRSQSETAKRLQEEQAAFQTFADGQSGFDIQSEQLQRFGVTPEKLKELEDIQLQLADRQGASNVQKVQIAGAAGQTIGQAQRELTQQDREEAVRSATLASRANVLQGNIETGRQLANDAVNIALQDRTFQANAKLSQINQLKEVVSEETRQLLVAEERKYEAEVATINELKKNISEAMMSGASQQEVSQMNDPNISDADKLALAQSVIARNASADIALDRQSKQANISQGWAGLQLRQDEFDLAKQKYENEQNDFGTGTITIQDGQKAVVNEDGTLTPISEIDFSNPAQVDALPVGSLTKAVLQGFAKTKDFTPTQKAEIMTELQNIGFNPNTYITNKLNGLVQSWAEVPEDSRGYLQGLKFWESKTNQDVAGFESQKTLLTREIARLFDVGVLSDQDVASYKDAMPSRQDSDIQVVLRKAGGISGAATGKNTEGVGALVELPDGRKAVVGLDGNTLLDPATGKPLE